MFQGTFFARPSGRSRVEFLFLRSRAERGGVENFVRIRGIRIKSIAMPVTIFTIYQKLIEYGFYGIIDKFGKFGYFNLTLLIGK